MILRGVVLTLACFGLVSCVPIASTPQTGACTSFIDIHVGESCLIRWANLRKIIRPTQKSLGFAIVLAKHKVLLESGNFDVFSREEVPVILGPDRVPYLIDAHHRLAALDMYHDAGSVNVRVLVSCDLSHLPPNSFWSEMDSRQLALLVGADLSRGITPDELPKSFQFNRDGTSFEDQVARSLVAFVEVWGSQQSPTPEGRQIAFVTQCTPNGKIIPFQDFSWAYYVSGALHNETFWTSQDGFLRFQAAFEKLPGSVDVSTFDPEPWLHAAESLVDVFHSSAAQDFEVPKPLPSIGGRLPGYTPNRHTTAEKQSCNNVLCG